MNIVIWNRIRDRFCDHRFIKDTFTIFAVTDNIVLFYTNYTNLKIVSSIESL